MVDDLDFLDDEEEEEQDEEFEDDDEFEDEFDDEFEDDFEDDFDDEFAAFGPVYVQGDVSRGFDQIAVFFGFAAAALSVFLLWTQVGSTVYDNPLGAVELHEYNGLGEGPGETTLSFAPAQVEVIGLGKYESSSTDYD